MSVFGGRRSGQRIGPINLAATKRLSNIFAFRAGAWAPRGPPLSSPGANNRDKTPHAGHYGPGVNIPASNRGGGPPVQLLYKYPHVETVMVGIPFSDNGFHVRKRYI